MTKRQEGQKTPQPTYKFVQPGRDGRSQPVTYVLSCERVDEEGVVAGLVKLLRRSLKRAPLPSSQQSGADVANDAADQRRDK
jgi:hypothetical protein